MVPQDKSAKPFRVIVVGGGIVGLSLAHALQLANINHVVLEKQDRIASLHGAALVIFPGAARIFDQFGIYKKMQDLSTPISMEVNRYPDGTVHKYETMVQETGKKFEMPVVLFSRQKCVSTLYDNLANKSNVRTSACVERIEHTDDGVKVYLTDGTVEEGDLVIGADGVHSRVRQTIWDYAAENEPGTIPESDKHVYSSQYKGLFGATSTEGMTGLGPSDVHVVYGYDTTKMLFTQPEGAYWALIYKDEYSQPPKRFKPSLEEQNEIAQRFKDLKMTENLTFGQLWENRSRGGVLAIEEGILDQWHAGRMVLVGDSAHKMTADLGIGANMGIESAVALCNVLQRETKDNPNRHFTLPELKKMFNEYQEKRHDRAKTFVNLSGQTTRARSWSTLWQRFFVTYIVPTSFMQNLQKTGMMTALAEAPKLEYVPTRTINEKAEGWLLAPKEDKKSSSAVSWTSYALVTSVIGVGISYMAVLKWGRPSF